MTVKQPSENCFFVLHVAGMTPVARSALDNIGVICEKNPGGNDSLEVIDLLDGQEFERSRRIFAVPTLVRQSPLDARKIIGDLANSAQLLDGLELREAKMIPVEQGEAGWLTWLPGDVRK